MKTSEQIEELKRQWDRDPIWDIESTEGFEDHYIELRAYHEECIVEWGRKSENRIQEEMSKMGLTDRSIYKLFKDMTYRIDVLEERLDILTRNDY